MKPKQTRQVYKKIFTGFLAAMAVFTFLSKALDSFTVPRVVTGYYSKGYVVYQIEGEGSFVTEGQKLVFTENGFKIQSVEKKAGDKVAAGDVLFTYRLEDLMEKRREITLELQKQELELSEALAGNRTVLGMTAEELALQSLDSAKRALELGQKDAMNQRLKADAKIAELEKKYNTSMNLTEEEMEEETRRSWKNAERAYDAAVKRKENAVKKAKRLVNDRERKLEKLEDNGASDEEIEEAENALEEAREDYTQVVEEEDLKVEEAYAAMEQAQRDYGGVGEGGRTAAEALTDSFEAAVEAEEEKVTAKEEETARLSEAVLQAELSVNNARRQDAASREERANEAEVFSYELKARELDLEETRRKLEEVDRFIQADGMVRSPWDGILTVMEAVAGKNASGEEIIAIGDERYKFQGETEREMAAKLSQGTKVTIRYGESDEQYVGNVETAKFHGDGETAEFTAGLETEIGSFEAPGSFTIELKSPRYDMIVPVKALRQDNKGYYILVAEPVKTILGEELRAVRIDVEIIEKSNAQAAVKGALAPSGKLILSSSKTIDTGDRVREAKE